MTGIEEDGFAEAAARKRRRRSWWGWGFEDQALGMAQRQALVGALVSVFGATGAQKENIQAWEAPELDEIEMRSPRVDPPRGFQRFCSTDRFDRAAHTHGKAFVDVVRAFHGDLVHPPDIVAFPRRESDVEDVLDWCSGSGIAVVPFGGGSSVAGGVSCDVGDAYHGVVSLDMSRMNRVVDIDKESRAALIQAGTFGPELEEQLRPHGYTLRHFPQSFEHSTLGGWLATRSGGHFATNYTHIDDFVESMRLVTPHGTFQSRRLPGSGAGPSPDRFFLGSEGTLGVITDAWMRIQDRPRFKASAGVHFPTFDAGVGAVRALSQSGLFPSNCRLLDPEEAGSSAGVSDGSALLVVGFESADHEVTAWIQCALQCCADHGGSVPDGVRSSSTEGTAGAWRSSFMWAPYWRDAVMTLGCIAETFETAVTWDRFDALHTAVMAAVRKALARVCGGGTVTCRFTHVYPDGPAPYFTVTAPSSHGSQIAQWTDIKDAATAAIIDAGGTITHHHAVGRYHRDGYDRQRPQPFADVLVAAKATLDPAAILNPGVLIDPAARGRPTGGTGPSTRQAP